MAKKSKRRGKHIPKRTCVGCREVTAKKELMRLVRTPEGIFPDESGKLAGRGAYVHANKDCLQRALQGGLEGALRTTLQTTDRKRLEEFKESLPEKREATAAA